MTTRADFFLLNAGAIGNETPGEQQVRSILAAPAGTAKEWEALMRRHSQRLYRVCRAVVASDAAAEDALQDAYLRAYRNLRQFSGESKFAVWLTRIAIYEALMRRRRSPIALEKLRPELVSNWLQEEPIRPDSVRLLEQAIDSLPPNYRSVFVLRYLEELDDDETAACLMLSREAVETRFMRSRRMLQDTLGPHVLEQPVEQVLPFRGARCASLTQRVLKRITQPASQK